MKDLYNENFKILTKERRATNIVEDTRESPHAHALSGLAW